MSEKTSKPYKIISQETTKEKQLELVIEISETQLNTYREGAIKELGSELKIDGFRPGNAPEEMVTKKLGELTVLEEVAQRAIRALYPIVLVDEKIEAITQPEISITKIAPGSALEFKATLTVMPDVQLPDYKKIAKGVAQSDKKELEVTDKEVDEYIENIRKQRAQSLKMTEQKEKGSDVEKNDDTKSCSEKDCNDTECSHDKKEVELPELNDDFVKSLGDFKTVDDFKKKLSENISEEKKTQAAQKRRLQIIEDIIKETKVEIPDVLIEEELDHLEGKFRHDIEQFKMNLDDYLKELKKTIEDLRKEWRDDAQKRVVMNLILPKIAQEEKVQADEKKIKQEVEHIKEHHPEIDDMRAHMYVASTLTNEAVFEFLEGLSM